MPVAGPAAALQQRRDLGVGATALAWPGAAAAGASAGAAAGAVVGAAAGAVAFAPVTPAAAVASLLVVFEIRVRLVRQRADQIGGAIRLCIGGDVQLRQFRN